MLLLSVFCVLVARVHWHKEQFSTQAINVLLKKKRISHSVSSCMVAEQSLWECLCVHLVTRGDKEESAKMDMGQLPAVLQQQARCFQEIVEQRCGRCMRTLQADCVPMKEKELMTTKRAFTVLPNYSGKVEEYEHWLADGGTLVRRSLLCGVFGMDRKRMGVGISRGPGKEYLTWKKRSMM